jgi:DNA-binding beta-propeller fold protein YncE
VRKAFLRTHWSVLIPLALLVLLACFASAVGERSINTAAGEARQRRLLYVAAPGIRSYLEHGGHGLLAFDIDDGHRFVKRIPTAGRDPEGKPLSSKGIIASAVTKRIWISTTQTLTSIDLLTEKILWEKSYEGGCDRMALSPDGKVIYLPSFEKDHWHVVDALTGEVIKRLEPKSGAHNTVFGPDGKRVYLAGLKSNWLNIAATGDHSLMKPVGPFGDFIRPLTVNGSQTLCFVNVNKLLGFEVGDLRTGKMLHRVEVRGFEQGPVKRHSCPSHGIGMTPDEKEVWVCDAFNQRLHIFDAAVMPPKQVASIQLQREQPGWITFSIDGRYAYPSTGEVIDVKTRKIITGLKDERGVDVHSEKLLEIDFNGDQPVRTGDQFGIGRVRRKDAGR